MRGVAALAVVLYHFHVGFASAYLGVDFFYTLSGFVLSRGFQRRLADGMTAGHFMKLRVARLYPLFGLGLCIGVLAELLATAPGPLLSGSELLCALISEALMLPSPGIFLLPNVANPLVPLYPVNGPGWSVFWELAVNVVFAMWICRAPTRRLVPVTAVLAAVYVVQMAMHGSADVGWQWPTFWGGPARVGFCFCAGVLLHRSVRREGGGAGWKVLIPIVVLIAGTSVAALGTVRVAYDAIFVIVIAPVLVWLGAKWDPPCRFATACRLPGAASYPVYILHRPCMRLIEQLGNFTIGGSIVRAGLFLVALEGIAIVLATTLDPRMRGALEAAFGIRKVNRPSAPGSKETQADKVDLIQHWPPKTD